MTRQIILLLTFITPVLFGDTFYLGQDDRIPVSYTHLTLPTKA